MDASWSKRVSQRLTEPPAELHGAHLGSSGRAFGVTRETIFGPNSFQFHADRSREANLRLHSRYVYFFWSGSVAKSEYRRPSCPGNDFVGLESDATVFLDLKMFIGPKKSDSPRTRGRRAHIRTRSRHS